MAEPEKTQFDIDMEHVQNLAKVADMAMTAGDQLLAFARQCNIETQKLNTKYQKPR